MLTSVSNGTTSGRESQAAPLTLRLFGRRAWPVGLVQLSGSVPASEIRTHVLWTSHSSITERQSSRDGCVLGEQGTLLLLLLAMMWPCRVFVVSHQLRKWPFSSSQHRRLSASSHYGMSEVPPEAMTAGQGNPPPPRGYLRLSRWPGEETVSGVCPLSV